MSANTSAGRVFYGVQSDNYGISRPAQSQAVDLRQLVPQRKQRAAAVRGGGVGSPLAGLSDMTNAVIANAKPRKPEQQGDGLRQHAKAILDALTDQAEDQAAQPTGRHVYDLPSGRTAASTADTRGAADQWGRTVTRPAVGPRGSTGDPAGGFMGGTFDTIGGAF